MTKKRFKAIEKLYNNHEYITANGEYEAFKTLTGIKISEADYVKIRRFSIAVSLNSMFEYIEQLE